MIHELLIREHNVMAHRDLDIDIIRRKNGLLTFTVKVNNGNIVDYMVMENDNYGSKKDRRTD